MPPGTLESGDKTGGHRQQNYTTWEPLGGAPVFLQGPQRGDFLQEWGSVGSWVAGGELRPRCSGLKGPPVTEEECLSCQGIWEPLSLT